ncbi:glycosyltransferase [Alteromonadaceae bacterium BrNp21-10]|nr:glycosyltransferase [Alteromonadaceae bacterium BrNp21-10]
MKKKIAIFIDSMNGGGAEKVVLFLAEALQGLGHEVILFVLHKRVEYVLPVTLPVHYLHHDPKSKTKGWLNRQSQAGKLRQQVDKVQQYGKFDLFLVNLEESYRIVSACHFSPCFYVIHNSLEETLQRTKRLGPLQYYYLRRQIGYLNNKNLIAVSYGVEDEIKASQLIRPASTQTIYNPFDVAKIKQLAALPDTSIPKAKYIIHIGRFAKQKRYDILLSAFKQVSEEYLLVCLCGNTQKLKRMAEKMGLKSRLIAPGFVQNPYSWIKQAKLLVLSSDYEGFGNVLVEAIICETPVVSTNCPHGPNEILTGTLVNNLVPRGDPDKLADKINQLLKDRTNLSNPEILKKVQAVDIAQQYLGLI